MRPDVRCRSVSDTPVTSKLVLSLVANLRAENRRLKNGIKTLKPLLEGWRKLTQKDEATRAWIGVLETLLSDTEN